MQSSLFALTSLDNRWEGEGTERGDRMNDVVDQTRRKTLTAEDWRERVLDGVGRRLDRMVASNEVTDFSADTERVTVNAMADAVQTANRINDRLGPFFTTDRVRKVLGGVSR